MSLANCSSDQDLERRVFQYLWDRRVPSLRKLSVEAQCGAVTLSGNVQSFYEKQLCQNVCRRVAGVVQFVNDVTVTGVRSKAIAT